MIPGSRRFFLDISFDICDYCLMFVRVKRSVQNGREYKYLQIVHSVRQGADVRQKVIANLGRAEGLVAGGVRAGERPAGFGVVEDGGVAGVRGDRAAPDVPRGGLALREPL